MRDLIERLEKATGPDRELDVRIALAVGKSVPLNEDDIQRIGRDPNPDIYACYTASIDAAMTLLPTDTRIVLTGCNQSWHVALNSTPKKRRHPPRDGFGPSAAVAISIAAIRVRDSLTTGNLAAGEKRS